MAHTFLILGGNLGDRYSYMDKAKALIAERLGNIILASSFYETEPWGFSHEQLFLNQVIRIETSLLPSKLLDNIKEIEMSLGRMRDKDRYSARTIDVDILFYDDLIIASPDLIIPHPRIASRRFVLEPLAEIAPELIHPVYHKTIGQLLETCEDTCNVRKLELH